MSENKVRAHIEVFRLTKDDVRYAQQLDVTPEPPITVITYLSPQRRVAIFGSNDTIFRTPPQLWRSPETVLARGTWEECFPIFEAYARML